MENVLLVILLILALALIAIVLLQRSEGGGLGIGGGGGVMSARGAATALGKVTWALGIAFLAMSLAMTIVSARNDKNRAVTEQWLANYGIHYDALYMRKDGDYRRDSVFKQELLDNIRGEDLIERVYDDRNQVVDMWRANGIDCIQVVPRDQGEF